MAKKSNYWQERFLEEEERINKDARAHARRIEQQYDMALRNIERDINDWYVRIAKNNNVSLLEAKRMLSAKELAEFKWSVKEYIKAGETNAISPIWLKELENASARVHISRLEALKIQIQSEVEGIYGVRDKEMQNYLVRTYGETYYHTAYEIQKGNGVGWSLNRLDTNKVNTIIHKPWAADGKNFSERIWEDKTKLINTLHTGLTQNFIRGEAPDKLISSITKEFNIKKSTAARLVMTESAAYSSQAREKSFNSIGVKKYEIIATLDSKTSEICQKMDGKVFDMKDYQVGVTAPPFHVWCRTTTAPWFPENYDAERAARGTDGKTYYVPENMNYKDWKEKYVDGIIKESGVDNCKTVAEVEALMRAQRWFYVVNDFDGNEPITLEGCDLESAKQIFKSHKEIYDKFPQLIGKLAGPTSYEFTYKHGVYAECLVGLGAGGVSYNTKYYSNHEKIARSYLRDVALKFHPVGTDWTAIATHEFGHAIDDYLTNTLKLAGMNKGRPKAVSAMMKTKVMRAAKVKVINLKEAVCEYASQNSAEWFAECFAEYMKSENPRPVAAEFGRQLEEILKGVK